MSSLLGDPGGSAGVMGLSAVTRTPVMLDFLWPRTSRVLIENRVLAPRVRTEVLLSGDLDLLWREAQAPQVAGRSRLLAGFMSLGTCFQLKTNGFVKLELKTYCVCTQSPQFTGFQCVSRAE
jgi:hypothetical protein